MPVVKKIAATTKAAPAKASKAAAAKAVKTVKTVKTPAKAAATPATARKTVKSTAAKTTPAKAVETKAPRSTRLYYPTTKLANAVRRVSAHLTDRGTAMARKRDQGAKDQGKHMLAVAADMGKGTAYWACAVKPDGLFTADQMFLAVDMPNGDTLIFAADNGDVLATLKGANTKRFTYYMDADSTN